LAWLGTVRDLGLELRGPRPPAGLSGLDTHFAGVRQWGAVRPRLAGLEGILRQPISLLDFARGVAGAAHNLAGENAWRGAAGRAAAERLAELQASPSAL